MEGADKLIEDAGGRTEAKRKAGVNIILTMLVHAQQSPLWGPDREHAEGSLQGHDSFPLKLFQEGHSIIDGGVVEADLIHADVVIDAMTLQSREMEYHHPLAILFQHQHHPLT